MRTLDTRNSRAGWKLEPAARLKQGKTEPGRVGGREWRLAPPAAHGRRRELAAPRPRSAARDPAPEVLWAADAAAAPAQPQQKL